MLNYAEYLLYTDRSVAEFKTRYAGYIDSQREAFVKWIEAWPAREWMDYLAGVPDKNIPVIIGTICTLKDDGLIDIEFNKDATKLRRCWTPEERAEFWGIEIYT